MTKLQKSLKFIQGKTLSIILFVTVPRTIQHKVFSDLDSIFLFLYAIIDLEPRNCTLKTKYIKGFELPRLNYY